MEKDVIKEDDREPIDLITCEECKNLRGGYCWGFTPTRHPNQWLLRRCEKFIPLSNAEDQRNGVSRWPSLTEKHVPLTEEQKNVYRNKG